MYIATEEDRLWLQNVQRKLYARSQDNPDYQFKELWGLVTDPRNLRMAFARVQRNRGARSAGIDRMTVRKVVKLGAEFFLIAVRKDLRGGSFRPSPVRRVLIPKPGKPGTFRPLGIPTVKDRVVQAAMKHILEPIFEAGFLPVSYGFRPGKSVHGALAHLKTLLLPRGVKRWKTVEKPPFQWVIEGDIKGCFDHIDHHPLMERVRRRIRDIKLNRFTRAFLKAGVLSDKRVSCGKCVSCHSHCTSLTCSCANLSASSSDMPGHSCSAKISILSIEPPPCGRRSETSYPVSRAAMGATFPRVNRLTVSACST